MERSSGPGETIKLLTHARTLERMVEAERGAKSRGRAAAIAAARDRFYKGDIAKEMVAFLQEHGVRLPLVVCSSSQCQMRTPNGVATPS